MKRIVAMRACAAVGAVWLALVASGCAQPAAEVENPLGLAAADRQAVRKATIDVLEEMYFEVERPPRSPGRVNTLPMVSAYPGEFWRPDTRTSRDKVESALHTVRRTVTVALGDGAGGAASGGQGVTVAVEVRKERLSLPGSMDATSANEAYGVFSGSRKALGSYEEHWGRGQTWTDLGRDTALEQYILSEIRKKL